MTFISKVVENPVECFESFGKAVENSVEKVENSYFRCLSNFADVETLYYSLYFVLNYL